MKFIMPMLLLAVLSVSCGNKNSSGGSSNNSDTNWDTLQDNDVYSNSSYQQEEKIKKVYLKALRDTFNKNKAKIKRTLGNDNYNLIQSRLTNLQVTAENRVMEEIGTRQVVSSFYDGFTMMIYTGTEEKAHSWRFLLKKRDAKTSSKLYNDVVNLRNTGYIYDDYNSYSSYSRSYSRGNGYSRSYRRSSGNGGLGGSYQFYFRTNL